MAEGEHEIDAQRNPVKGPDPEAGFELQDNHDPVYLVLPGTRGICRELVDQLLRIEKCTLITTHRQSSSDLANQLKHDAAVHRSTVHILKCDVAIEEDLLALARSLHELSIDRIDLAVVGPGILEYPRRISEVSFDNFAHHLKVNTIGPLLAAQHILRAVKHVDCLVFLSSDSGSAQKFLEYEDGFGVYAASKAALNQGLRHLAAERHRQHGHHQTDNLGETVIMAIHPGEVNTDMAQISISWDVPAELTLSPEESVQAMLSFLPGKIKLFQKERRYEAMFYNWKGEQYPW